MPSDVRLLAQVAQRIGTRTIQPAELGNVGSVTESQLQFIAVAQALVGPKVEDMRPPTVVRIGHPL